MFPKKRKIDMCKQVSRSPRRAVQRSFSSRHGRPVQRSFSSRPDDLCKPVSRLAMGGGGGGLGGGRGVGLAVNGNGEGMAREGDRPSKASEQHRHLARCHLLRAPTTPPPLRPPHPFVLRTKTNWKLKYDNTRVSTCRALCVDCAYKTCSMSIC